MNKCTTLSTTSVDEFGNPKEKQKKTFFTLDSAIIHAKQMNARQDRTQKVVAYKCDTCFRYHVGRNGNIIKDKEKVKIQKSLQIPKVFKILGKIDLSLIPKK